MKRKRGRNPVELLGLLGILGIGALWDSRFSLFALFVLVPVLIRLRPDERFQTNVALAGRDAFVVAMAGLAGITLLSRFVPVVDQIAGAVVALFVLLSLLFTGSLLLRERRGF